MKIKCIICDDEPLARKGMENFVREIPFLEMTAQCGSVFELMETLSTQQTDLLFLDIQMPKMTGLDFLRSVSQPPMTIITSAYSHFAIEGYELAVLDYLLKPIPFNRFVNAVSKARDYFELKNAGTPETDRQNPDYCFIKCDKAFEKILYADIVYIEALINYVVIHTKNKKHITYLTLKAVEDQLPATGFIKINKSYMVSLQHVERIEGNEMIVGGQALHIGRTFKQPVMELLLKERLMKR
jgi:DNA-binding LytR/AlgR family response regulator